MIPDDINVFPIDTNNQKLTDCKQLIAAQKSLRMLQSQIADQEGNYGPGYKALLAKRVTETEAIINKIKEKYEVN